MNHFRKHSRGLTIWIGAALCLIILLLLTGLMVFHAKRTPAVKDAFQITTIPLKVNNSLYIGNHPLYQNQQTKEYFFPVPALAEMLGIAYEANGNDYKFGDHMIQPEKGLGSPDTPYIGTAALQNFQELHIYYEDLAHKSREVLFIDNFPQPFDYSWTKHVYVAHAFGEIDGYTYTNSLEAFQLNYERGHRVFEVDFSLTADHDLVAVHDWSDHTMKNACGIMLPEEKIDQPLTTEEFLSYKLHGKYTPLTFQDIILLMKEYPDIYIVTDTKETQEPYITEQFQLMKEIGEANYAEALDRFIPQIYNEQMLTSIMNVYPWKSVIYTMYGQGDNFSEKSTIDFAYKNGIKVIATYISRAQELFFDELLQRGGIIYMYTYNTAEEFDYLKGRGVTGVYTDVLTP